jgi:branched-chain amino acid transport system substrate-binding protein
MAPWLIHHQDQPWSVDVISNQRYPPQESIMLFERALQHCRRLAVRALLACAALLPGLAGAQLLIGQTSDFSGAAASGVQENTAGAQLFFAHVNAAGGIHGQRVELISLDDKLDVKRATENAKTLIVEKQVLALFLNRGTPHTQAIMPLLAEHGVALVAPSTGAMAVHEPVHPWVFNVRATYQREVERAVLQLAAVGLRRIALVAVDDSFGADCAEGALKGFQKAGFEPVVNRRIKRGQTDFSEIAALVVKADAQAVLFHAAAKEVADGAVVIRAAGSKAQIVTQSTNASAGFVQMMGPWAHGTIVTQVFPSERTKATALVREADALAKRHGNPALSPAFMEGYVGAKVLVEGLRRAGPKPSREGLRRAMESITKMDIGGLEISYSPTDHTGLDYSDMSIIGRDGRFQR